MSELNITSGGLPRLKLILRNAAQDVYRTTMRATLYTLVWRWLAAVAVLFALDLLLGLPVWLRWLALAGQAVYIGVGLHALFGVRARSGSGDEWAARVVEERHPELDNALIHAVQFERVLPGADAEQAELIRREMTRAERTAANIPPRQPLDSAREQAALRKMAALLGGWALVGVLFSGGFMAILPRLFLPWMDEYTPPYSATHFDVRPPGATVRYDDSLTITVAVSGRRPENVALMTQSQGKTWHRVALDLDNTDSYSVKLDALRDDTLFYVQGSTGRSATYRIRVTRPPVLTGLHVKYTYPAYTARKPSTETVGPDGVHGLAGTGVALEVTSSRELRSGEIDVRTAEGSVERAPLTLAAGSPTRAVAEFTIHRPGEYRIGLTATDDQSSPDAGHGKVTLDHDQRPNVWFTFPAQDLLVTPAMTVPLHVKAEDDVAVERVQIHRHVNTNPDAPRDFTSRPPAKQVEQDLAIDLPALGVHAGDQITYFATAYDNAPGTPNVGETEVYTLKVVTPEEFAQALKEQRQASDLRQETHDMVDNLRALAEQQKELARRMDDLRHELATKPNDSTLLQRLAEARSEQKDLQKQARDLAESLANYSKSPSATDLERALKKKIAEIASALGATAQGSMQQGQSGDSAQSAAGARAAAKQLEQLQKQMEQQVQKAVEYLAEILPLFDDTNRFMALLEQQKQLVQRARSFEIATHGLGDIARMALLADEQSRIARDLSQLQKDFAEHADACEEHFPKAAASARKIAAEIESRRIVPLMDSARDRFRVWDGPAGFQSAQNALQQMEAMVKECQGSGGQAGMESELDISLSRCLGQSGLGQSLGQFGSNGSMGFGTGMGGTMQGSSGQAGGGTAVRGAKAFVPSVASMGGSGGPKKLHHANHAGAVPAGLSGSEVESVRAAKGAPPKGADTAANGYPAEYRKLIHDYFKSVADKQ